MDKLEKVILGIENCITTDSVTECRKTECPFITCRESCLEWLLRSALSLLKAQEQEISRLKHHIDCDAAEKLPSGCVGYGRGFNDDEPCETCKACEKYNGYGEE